jgi:hypothetical protein
VQEVLPVVIVRHDIGIDEDEVVERLQDEDDDDPELDPPTPPAGDFDRRQTFQIHRTVSHGKYMKRPIGRLAG